MRILIVLLSRRDQLLERLKRLFAARPDVSEIIDAQEEQEAKVLLAQGVDLVVVCIGSFNPERGLELITRLRAATKTPILVVGPANDSKLILRAIQVGADVFLDQADMETEMDSALVRLQLKQEIVFIKGRLIAVLSASGGCGGSTLSVNIAAVLANKHGACGLIDLNPGQGDVASLLDLRPVHNLADVCKFETRLDRPMFEKMLTCHCSGIHLLNAPDQYEDSRSLSARGVKQAVSLARSIFLHVVVDLEDCFHEEQVAVLQEASGIFLIARLDFTALRNARRVLDQLSKLGIARNRTKVIINQHGLPNELPLEEAEDAVGEKLTRFVPHDPKAINTANNTGMPAVAKCSDSKFGHAIAVLANIDFDSTSPASGLIPVLKHLWKAIG